MLQTSEVKRARKPAARSLPSAAAAEPSEADEELRSLQAVQAELAARPADAVQRLRAHQKAWPSGWLDEERAALLVEALLRAG